MPERSKTRRYLRISAVLVVLLLIGIWAADWIQRQFATIHETDARITTDLVAVSSRVSGWVTELSVQEGDIIEVGEALVAIDSRDAQLKLTEITALLEGIQAQREQLTAQVEMIDAQTTSRLEAKRASLAAAQIGVETSVTNFELASSEYERIRSLFERRVVSQQRWDEARAGYDVADEQRRRSQVELVGAQAIVRGAEASRQQIDILQREMARLTFQEQQIGAQRDRQALDLADRVVGSAINGVVDRLFVDAGEFVQPGQRLLLAHDPDNIWIEANIKETKIRRIRPGAAVRISVDAYPDETFEGVVERVGSAATNQFALLPSPNPSGNFTKITQRLPVRIAIEQRDGLLRPGMMVEVDIVTKQ
ncbi:MAG: HlyD family secretion protein [Alphaproteobacteria bacterium]